MSYLMHKSEGAHFNQAKWSASQRAVSAILLCFAMLVCSFAGTGAGSPLADAYYKGSWASATAATDRQHFGPFSHAVAQTYGGSAMAQASAGSHLFVPPPPPVTPVARPQPSAPPAPNPITHHLERMKKIAAKRAEIDAILKELIELEGRPTDSMDECSRWYELHVNYHDLTHKMIPFRESEAKKQDECDALYKFVEETRQKFQAFTSLAHESQIDYILYVKSILHEYLDLKQAISFSEQMANEFDYLVQSDEHVRKQVEELENLLNYAKEAQNPAAANEKEAAASEEPAPVATGNVSAAEAELRELDGIIKNLIDREETLSPEELEQLAELGGLLDRALADGIVPTSSGKFQYLQGTLNGIRAIIVRKMVEAGMAARAAEEAAKKAAEEEAAKKAAEEEAARKAAEEEAARKAAEEEAAKKAAEEEAARKAAEEEAAKKAAEEEAAKKAAEEEAAKRIRALFSRPPPPPIAQATAEAQTNSNGASARAETSRSSASASSHVRGAGYASAQAHSSAY